MKRRKGSRPLARGAKHGNSTKLYLSLGLEPRAFRQLARRAQQEERPMGALLREAIMFYWGVRA